VLRGGGWGWAEHELEVWCSGWLIRVVGLFGLAVGLCVGLFEG
jgi:hypothetical protein